MKKNLQLYVRLVFIKVGIIWHEMGHLFFARWAGGTPQRMILGKGHEAYRATVAGVLVIVNSKFQGGFAFSSFKQTTHLKARKALYVSGGVLFNLVPVAVLYLFVGFDPQFPSLTMGEITPKVLSKELRDLELNYFVERKVFPTTPVTVMYELTPYSQSLDKVLEELRNWGTQHRLRIQDDLRSE